MGGILITLILELVLKIGIPALVTWLKKRFGIGADSETVQILEDYQREAKEDRVAARARARLRLRNKLKERKK